MSRIEAAGADFGRAIAEEIAGLRQELHERTDHLAARLDTIESRMASKDDLERFATKDDFGRFATKDDLERFATKDDFGRFATKEDLKAFATKEDLERFATKEDLKAFATKEDLERYASKEDLKAFATKDDLRLMAREIIRAVNANTMHLRDELNEQFEQAGMPIRLGAAPRRNQ